MRAALLSSLALILAQAGVPAWAAAQTASGSREYAIVVEGYDWEQASARSSSRSTRPCHRRMPPASAFR